MSADHLQLVETVGRHEDEMRRWAAKLAPKPIPGDDCCTYSCTGGHGCPVRETPLPLLDRISDLPAPTYCDRAKQPCLTPHTCAQLCRLITAEGGLQIDDGLPVQLFEPRRWYQRPAVLYAVVSVGACIGFGLALYQTF